METVPEDEAAVNRPLRLSPFYHSAVNEVTKPSSLVFASRYFVERWMRELGPTGTAIILALRRRCFSDRKTGEVRDRIQVAVPEIAAECGVSDKTVRRELEGNETLRQFVRIAPEFAAGRTPMSVRRDANSYQVAMDDPVHPEDEARLLEIVHEKERVGEKGGIAEAKRRAQVAQMGTPEFQNKNQREKPLGQFDQAGDKLTRGTVNLTRQPDKLSRGSGQFDQALKESFSFPENPLNPSSEFSLSLFQEPETIQAWSQLTETEQQLYRLQAEQELIAMVGLAEWPKLRASGRDRQVSSRAETLYRAAMKAG